MLEPARGTDVDSKAPQGYLRDVESKALMSYSGHSPRDTGKTAVSLLFLSIFRTRSSVKNGDLNPTRHLTRVEPLSLSHFA